MPAKRENPAYRVKFSNGLWRVYDRKELLHNANTETEARTWLRTFKLRVDRKRNNPSEYAAAAAASEEFHGIPSSEIIRVETDYFEHDHLADCGELVSLVIKSENGGIVTLTGFEGARLARSPQGYPFQLYIEGGDQSVNLKDFGITRPHESEVLGRAKRITYYTIKHHLGRDGGEANYKHKLGEVTGQLPVVIYDVLNKALSFSGGAYTILPEGIDD